VHCSDLHFGHGFIPARAEQLLDRIKEVAPDAVVVSGDLTMRARPAQFAEARAFLQRIGVPLLIIPGNHDVPLYDLFARAMHPFANYHAYMDDLSTNPLTYEHVAFVGLNTVNPRRHQQGIVRDQQLAEVAVWGRSISVPWKIAVVHQHFANVPGHHRPGAMPNPEHILQSFASSGVQAVLHGHAHYNRVTTTREFFPSIAPAVALICVGTATSERTRGEDRTNSYNVLQFTPDKFLIRQCNWDPISGNFSEIRQFAFTRDMFNPASA
jgi:3',5'-cyclic AMP phosphodiesterase CpdA